MSLRIPRSLPTAAQKIGRAIGAGIITPGGGGGGTGLTLSAFSYASDAEPGTVIGTFSNRKANSKIDVVPGDGRYAISSDGTKLLVGLARQSVTGIVPTVFHEVPLDGTPARLTALNLNCDPKAAPAPIAPFAASQLPAGFWSMKKENPAYTGACLQVRDSNSTIRTLPFKTDGSRDYDATGFSGYGDGLTFTVTTFFDSSGGGRSFTSTLPARLVFPNAPANYDGAYIDYSTRNQNMVTATGAEFISIGGTANLSVLMVMGTFGWSSSATHARSPAVFSNAVGPALGYGTSTDGGPLLYGAANSLGETTFYNLPGQTLVEEGTPDNTRIRNVWYNQRGAKLSGGIDTRKVFTGREHGQAASGPHRLVLGNRGSQNQSHNGPIYELIVYQSATPMSDDEVWAISQHRRAAFGLTSVANVTTRFGSFGGGQSLMSFYATVASASTGQVADYASTRIFTPELRAHLGITGDASKILDTTFATTAIGGSSVLKGTDAGTPDGPGGTSWLAWDGASTTKKFWWDQDLKIPGPIYLTWLANLPAILGGIKYRRVALPWAQGPADASRFTSNGETGSVTLANYKTYLKVVFGQMRIDIGRDAVIVIQPEGRQNGTDEYTRKIRMIQTEIAREMTGVYIGPETTHLTRQDTVHFGAGPADPNGFDRGAKMLARSVAYQMGVTDIVWRGPNIASAVKSGANTVDVTIEYGRNCGGTDFAAQDGSTSGLVGFEVTDVSGARTVSAAVKVNATIIRLTVSGAALSSPVTVAYNTTPSGLDRLKMIVDNFSALPMPLRQTEGVIAA